MTNIVNPTWAGPSLFVPMFPEVLLIGKANLGGAWAMTGCNYSNLPSGDIAPPPFSTNDNSAPGVGVNLMWTLPAALRSGAQKDSSGVVEFPLAPNRWLVTRIKAGTGKSPPALTAWVLQSDFIGADGANPYPDPGNPGDITNIGRVVALGSWTGAAGPGTPFLTAVAPGDVSYAAVYANIGAVFGFCDALTDADIGTYAYSILGWYATPDNDPLFGKTVKTPAGFTSEAQWADIVEALGWTTATGVDTAEAAWNAWQAANPVSGGPSTTPAQLQDAAQVLCHAFIYGISWKGVAPAYPTYGSTSGAEPPAVAIGSNGAEAIAVWLANTVATSDSEQMIENLLLALRNNLALEYVRDPAKYETATHAQRFGNSNSGLRWVVQRPTDAQASPVDAYGGNTTIPLDADATRLLTELNAAQAALDELNATTDSLRQELFAALWKQQNGMFQPPPIKQRIDAYVTRLSDPGTGLIPANVAAAKTAQDKIAAAVDQLKKALVPPPKTGDVAPVEYVVSSVDQPRYYAPVDPVVLVAGPGLDTKLSAPATFHGEEALPGRFTGQTISALTVTIAGVTQPVTLVAEDLLPALGLSANPAVPKEVPDFWLETLLLDPGNVTWLAYLALAKGGLANPTDAQVQAVAASIAKQQTMPFAGNNLSVIPGLALGAVAGFTGVPPDAIAVDPWTPPWTPIYMDWEVAWSPSVASPDDQSPPGTPSYLTGMLDGWRLDEVDYTWTGSVVPSPQESFLGRTVLTPNQGTAFTTQLTNFLNVPANLAQLPEFEVTALQKAQQQLSNLDVMTQALSGLGEQMLMRQSAASQLGINAATALLQSVPRYIPGVGGPPSFYPIRSGHFTIQRLWIVDAFGQIVRVIDAERNVHPYIAQSVATPGAGNEAYVQVPPRITQPARLDARLVEADSDAIASNSSDATSPICGWVMPNHLDDSLTVFDAAGNNLGALITVENDQGNAVRWDVAPGLDLPLGSAPQIANRHLAGFVKAILAMQGATQAAALASLLDVIDLTLWKTDPLGQPTGGNLAVLVGRPIAVVRVGVTLRLDGMPAVAQNWVDTGKNNTRGFPSVPFPIRVGDFGLDHNGVTGYFLNGDYAHFYAANGHNPSVGSARRMLKRGNGAMHESLRALLSGNAIRTGAATTGGNYVVDGFAFSLPPDGATTAYLTAFVDPRGHIPVVSGIQPLVTLTLPPGPVATALNAMFVTFRIGPVLTDPEEIGMPLPSAVTGKWSWIERSGVSVWREDGKITPPGQTASLPAAPPSLREGWLKLSGAFGEKSARAASNRRR